MDTHAAPEPVEVFVEGLRATSRLRPLRSLIYLGAAHRARATEPNRIVFYPTAAEIKPRARGPAQMDADITVEAAIWGASLRHLWEILRRLFWGWREYTRTSDAAALVEWQSFTWHPTDDGGEQGAAGVVTFVLRAQPLLDVLDIAAGEVQSTTITRET